MIQLHLLEVAFDISNPSEIESWLADSAVSECREIGMINVILVSDDHLLEMNRKYLNHDYFTDIITFDTSEGNTISGDLYISVDRVAENASQFKVSTSNELHRVMVHGLLHLCGFDHEVDEKEEKVMFDWEEKLVAQIYKKLS